MKVIFLKKMIATLVLVAVIGLVPTMAQAQATTRSTSQAESMAKIQQLLILIASLQKQLAAMKSDSVNVSNKATTQLSPWGKSLIKDSSVIPNGSFRAYWVNKDTLAQRLPPETVDQIYFRYITYATQLTHHGEQLGAYWIGRFDLKAGKPVYFDFSDPQWDKAELYIDGKLVHANAGLYIYTPSKSKRSTIEVTYKSNWHAGTFAVAHNLVADEYETDENGLVQQDAQNDLAKFLESNPKATVRAAAAYETANDRTGEISVKLPATATDVLVLSSYDPVAWRIVNADKNLKKIYVFSFAGASKVDVRNASPDIVFVNKSFMESENPSNSTVAAKLNIPSASVKQTKYQYSPTTISF